jgi:hypothetical protein
MADSAADLQEALRRIFTLDSFADGCAGAAGGVSAITMFYPLNIVRTKLQTADPAGIPLVIILIIIIINTGIFHN